MVAVDPDAVDNSQDALDLIQEYPLAWVCPTGGDPMTSTLLPLLAEVDGEGRVRSLLGHMARRNPLFRALCEQPQAHILFTGPQGYVSPAYVSDPTWAPSWNYAQVRIVATVRFLPEASDEALRTLLNEMEQSVPSGWTPANMGPRYERLQAYVIAFRADVTNLQARFKLGQEEKPEQLREILVRHPDEALVRWMRRLNAGRCD